MAKYQLVALALGPVRPKSWSSVAEAMQVQQIDCSVTALRALRGSEGERNAVGCCFCSSQNRVSTS